MYLKQRPFVEYAAKHWMLHFNLSGAVAGDSLCSNAVKLCETNSSRYRTWSKIYWNSYDRRPPPNTTDLSVAVAYDMVEVIDELIRRGYDIDTQDGDGDTALHAAALHGRENAAGRLIHHHASTTIKAKDGNTPLHSAAAKGAAPIVRLIAENGGKMDDVNGQGRTPLHRVAQFGHPEAAKILLDAGADVNATDQQGRTALHLASVLGGADIKSRRGIDVRKYNTTIKMLVRAGSDQSVADDQGMTASALYSKGLEELPENG